MKTRKIIVEIIAGLFIILWVYAGLNKMMDPEFSTQLHRSPYLDRVADLVQYTLPIGEIIIALLLVFPRTKLLGLYLSFFTMFLFTGYIYAMLKFSFYKPCSCGGILAKMDWYTHLYFNIAFTLLAAVAILLWQKPNNSEPENNYSFKNSYQL